MLSPRVLTQKLRGRSFLPQYPALDPGLTSEFIFEMLTVGLSQQLCHRFRGKTLKNHVPTDVPTDTMIQYLAH